MNRLVIGLFGLMLSFVCLAQNRTPACSGSESDSAGWDSCIGTIDLGGGVIFKSLYKNGRPIDESNPIGFSRNDYLFIGSFPILKKNAVYDGGDWAVYLDPRNSERVGKDVKLTILIDYPNVYRMSKSIGISSAHATIDIDCRSRKIIPRKIIGHVNGMGTGAALNFPIEGDLGELPNLKGDPFNLDFDFCSEPLSGIVSKLEGRGPVEAARRRVIVESERRRVVEKIKFETASENRRANDFAAVVRDKSQQRQRDLDGREALVSEQERLRTAELQTERKRREEREEKLRTAQQPPVVSAVVGKRVALVIGNAAYKQSPLDTPVNDAKDVAAALRVSGFETQELLNATKTQMLEATRSFERMVLNSDVALIYFAGHGSEVKGKNYMIPVGANIAREYELPEQAYDAAQWLDMLEGVKGTNTKRVNIVILDACRNNELTRSWRSSSNGLSKMDAPVGTFLAYSTAPGKVASDGDRGARNSPFAKHMLSAIKQPNTPIEQVFKRVRSAVIDETKGEQIPWDSSSLIGDFFFTVKE